MSSIKVSEVINGGMIFKFMVPTVDLDGIDQVVNKYIKVQIEDCVIIGELKKVSTKSFKPKDTKDAEKEVFKEITLEVEQINTIEDGEIERQNNLIKFPDKNHTIDYNIYINYSND